MPAQPDRRAVCSAVAKCLRKERLRRGMSLAAVAERAGISYQMISFVEQERRNPTLDTLLRICGAIDIDLPTLLRRAIREAAGR